MSNKDNKIDKIAQVAFFDLDNDIDDKSNETIEDKNSKKVSVKNISESHTSLKSNDSKKKITNKTNKKTSAKSKASKAKNISKATNEISSNKKSTKNKALSGKNKTTAKKNNQKVNFTQEDMDRFCELYDWYLIAKEKICNPIKEIREKTDVLVEENIIKTKKRISAIIDKDVWEDFDRLCNNSEHTKAEILTQIIKNYINKHSDLI